MKTLKTSILLHNLQKLAHDLPPGWGEGLSESTLPNIYGFLPPRPPPPQDVPSREFGQPQRERETERESIDFARGYTPPPHTHHLLLYSSSRTHTLSHHPSHTHTISSCTLTLALTPSHTTPTHTISYCSLNLELTPSHSKIICMS